MLEKIKEKKLSIVAIISIVIFCSALTTKTFQEDTYYLIKVGEYIVNNGIDKTVEPFSWHEGLPYSYPHWLYTVILYFVYNIWNFDGIYISVVILAVVLGIIFYITNKKISGNEITSFILTILIMYCMQGFIAARAQLPGYILFILEIYSIEQFLKTQKNRYILYLAIIPIIIANIHSATYPFYFILMLPYITEYIIAISLDKKRYENKIEKKNKIIEKLKNSKEKNIEKKITKLEKIITKTKHKIEKYEIKEEKRKVRGYEKVLITKNDNVKYLFLVILIALFGGLCTPIGDTPYMYIVHTLEGNTMHFIAEHQPMSLIIEKDVIVFLVLIIVILLFTNTKIQLRDVFTFGGLSLLSFAEIRQIAMLFLIGTLILNKLICDVEKEYRPNLIERIKNKASKFPIYIYIILIIGVISIAGYRSFTNTNYIDKSSMPVNATEWISKNLDVKNIKLFNGFNYGSYLLFNDIQVFIDGRADAYDPKFYKKASPNDIFTDYMLVSGLQQDYETTFEKYGITHVIVTQEEGLNLLLKKDKKYTELYSDQYFVIYSRNEENETEKISKME